MAGKSTPIIALIVGIIIGIIIGYGAGLAAIPHKAAAPTTITITKTATVTQTYTATKTAPATATQSPTATATKTAGFLTQKLVIGVTDKVTDLDPASAYDFFTWEVLTNIMDGLVKYKPGTDEIVPALAKSWEVKDNGKVWIFHLRTDAKFCDGTPVTAYDVVRSIKRVMRLKGDPSWLVTYFVKDVKALDKYTVEFILKRPVGFFLAVLATPPYFPVSPKYPNDKIVSDATWGGAGPYCIKEWRRDEILILQANPYYYGPKPKTKTIIIRFYRDASALRVALESGEIDIAWRTLRPTDYVDLAKNPNFRVIGVPGTFIRYIVVNVKMDPTKNRLVREAIAAAINRPELAKVVFMGTMQPLYSLVPAGMWSHIDAFKIYGDGNIALAQKLLKEAGYSKQHKLKLVLWYTPSHYGDTEADLAQMIKVQLERTGMIQVEIKSLEWASYVKQLRQGTMMLALLGWYPDYIDPDDFLTPFLHSGANKWTGTGYSNPKVDKLLDEAAVLTNKAERAKLYEEVQKILAHDIPFIPLLQGKLFVVVRKDVRGVKIGPPMLMPYYTLYKASG
ncbi:MAG: peptide ABC transporter substrate-binding protein [Crenarchaeota archaeon]|nr:peptide ABC transporter substrate-binding protein [Thermoproteota archaeon]